MLSTLAALFYVMLPSLQIPLCTTSDLNQLLVLCCSGEALRRDYRPARLTVFNRLRSQEEAHVP